MQCLKTNDWQDFAKLFPDAESWLLKTSLRREYELLKRWEEGGMLNSWQKDRLAELTEHYRTLAKIEN